MIKIRNLLFRYPRSPFVLAIDRLDVERGERVALVGPSGSGKTTLLNLISGIAVATQGELSVDAQEVSAMADAERRNFRISRIGMIFQQFELLPYLGALENILLPYRINHSLRLTRDVRQRAWDLLDRVGIRELAPRRPSQLSQGEQQRTALCRALITQPGLILADEPTGNLDQENKLRALALLREQCAEREATLVVVTHDSEILDQFDRVIDFRQFRHREGPG